MKFPTVTVVIATLNEEKNIAKCLNSIITQKYPKNKLEIIVVDNYSTDKTVEIVNKYKAKIIFNKKLHGEISKMIGFKAAKSELVFYLDADIELRGNNWLLKMIKPLKENENIVGSFTRYYSKKTSPSIEKYLNLDPLQRDGIYQYFSPKIEEVITDSKKGYYLCEYKKNKIPPAGLCVYKKRKLLPLVKKYNMFLELDFLVLLTKKGLNKFAYIPSAGLYHSHVNSFFNLLKKRKYNLQKVYLGREERLYKWFDMATLKGKLKVLYWVLYANAVLPSLLIGIYKSLKHKTLVGLYEPLVNFVLTDYLILLFLSNKKGIKVLKNESKNFKY